MTSPPRVLLLITQSELGGAQRYVLTLAKGLQEAGYEPEVACGEGGELIEVLKQSGIKTCVFSSLVREIQPKKDLKVLLELASYMRSRHFDLVHCNSTKAGIIGRIAARIAGVRSVFYTVHGCVLNEPMSRSSRLVYQFLEWATALITTQIIAVSKHDRDTMLRYRIAPARKIAVVPNGIDPGPDPEIDRSTHRHDARNALGIPEEAFVIGTIANFYPTKGLDVLLHATAIVADERPDLHLVLIGDGQERPLIDRLIQELSLGNRVILPGQLREGRQMLPAFDLFVLSSRKEGMPLALLEAMAAGLPVIVTDVGGMPQTVNHGHAGLVVPREDPDEMAAAILDIASSPELALMLGNEARHRVVRHFTEQRMIEQTIALYPIHPSGLRIDSKDHQTYEGHADAQSHSNGMPLPP